MDNALKTLRYSESSEADIPLEIETNTTQRALKDIHINIAQLFTILPEKNLVYLQNKLSLPIPLSLSRKVARWAQNALKKAVAIFFTL